MHPTLQIDDLGKCYRFAREGGGMSLPWGPRQEIWALRRIGFSVHQGEVIGLLGANGSGKSTLLKILTRITPPTEGKFTVQGQVGAILEVSCGFHSDLTGLENIYLNGAILGMRYWEVKQALQSVIAFSGLGEKVNWLIKRYSSGQRVRLGFAIAAHLSAEILLIDEALAVGDMEFQQQCIQKLRALAQSGRSVLFVSHDMEIIRRLCTRTIVLRQGQCIHDGGVDEGIKIYRGA